MTTPDLSICILTLNARDYLRACLQSIAGHTAVPHEIIVADNGSTDGTLEMLDRDFPQVRCLPGMHNEGFAVPMNRAMRQARGRYIALLNPDTLIHPRAFDRLTAFLDATPDAGIVGPKVLNPDGSLQLPCRRGDSRPWAVISYFSGLARRFPDDPRFTGYLLTHLDENRTYPVDGVSGSCMVIRRAVVEEIGYLDERFFAYQEDADYCLRARAAGWKVYYHPEAQITHFGGQGGSRVQPYRAVWAWHQSYFLLYRKHFAKDYFFLLNWLYYAMMGGKLIFALLRNALSRQPFGGDRKPG